MATSADSGPASSHAASSEHLTHTAIDLLAAGDPSAAAQTFRAAIHADSANLDAHHGLIRALIDAEQPAAAITAALALVQLTPNDPLAHTSLSIALQRAGQIPEAEAAAGRARILEWKQQLAQPPEAE